MVHRKDGCNDFYATTFRCGVNLTLDQDPLRSILKKQPLVSRGKREKYVYCWYAKWDGISHHSFLPLCCTVFADISNFTAGSSVREPGQVFSLLENIYGAFDSVAKRRGAYKVETIGDSYVAVAGVPVPRPDHAIVMVRFARDCRQMMSYLTRDLEITLGPGTGDLQMRFGLNSGK